MLATVQDICQKFESAWTRSARPRIEDFLTGLPRDQRDSVVQQLIEIEMRLRRAAGETPTASDYAQLVAAGDERSQTTCFSTRTRDEAAHRAPTSVEISPLEENIGRYRTQRLVGAGAYGMVVAAHDAELNRLVAIKIPLGRSAVDESLQLNEARAAAKLSHRGIVPVFDCGHLPDGRFFIVSEFVEGQTLADEVKAGPLVSRRVVEIMIDLADAVHHAHLHGLFHRDLKPSNILIDRKGQVRITDFGLVIDESEQYRFAGEVAGSPAYMSPEQVLGQSHFLDGRSDIWSLGVIFYELLAGRRPFRAPSLDQLRQEIIERSPRPLRQIDDAIPLELERCCAKCLERSLERRYASAADLAGDLRKWLSSQTAAPRTAERWPIKLARPAAFLVGLLVLVGLGFAFSSGVLNDKPASNSPQISAGSPAFEVSQTPPGQPRPYAALLQSPSPPKKIWIPLLDEQPRVLHWPLVPRNSERIYRADLRELTLTSDQFAMLEFGRTTARDFRLRARLHQSTWTGDLGIFWGYHERAEDRDLCFQSIWMQPYDRSQRQRHPAQLIWKSVALAHGGRLEADRGLQTLQGDPPEKEMELEIVVREGRLRQVNWNGKDLGKIEIRDPSIAIAPADCIGAFGIVVDGSSVLVRDAAIYLFD